jgi:D-3-phosphoglycerate dehydrogenase / 2-oxoglutarate reductase
VSRLSNVAEVSESVESLILDLLAWLESGPRPYGEVQDAWRTSCPRLPVWEEADSRGFIARSHEAERGQMVSVTSSGADHLRSHR